MAVWQLDDELWFPNASKLTLIHLAKAMERIGGRFIDCQFETPLFKSMSGRHITYEEYMKILGKATSL
jgi:leucyl/phenylalanyl-tRNA--protein transferase